MAAVGRELLAPFNIASPAECLDSFDAPPQHLVRDAVEALPLRADETPDFFNERRTTVSLAELERIYEAKDKVRALALLRRRHEISWADGTYVTANDNPQLVWSSENHYVDLLVCVAGRVGVSVLCPTERFRGFEQKFELKQRHRQFSAEFAKLGFDPIGSMLYIGRSFASEDVFIAWAPTDSLSTECENVAPGTCTGRTHLSTERYYMTIMLVAHLMKAIGYRDIYVAEDYPPLTAEGVERATNILAGGRVVSLGYQELQQLDGIMDERLIDWVENAPEEYTEDRFLLDRTPILVTSRYGQNMQLKGDDDDLNTELLAEWSHDRDYRDVHYISVAIATHIEVEDVDGWTDIDADNLWEEHGDAGIYDSPHPNFRNRLTEETLDDFPLLDADGHERPIYTNTGYPIPRRNPVVVQDQLHHAALVNFRDIGDFMMDNENEEDTLYPEGKPGGDDTQYDVYPQAGLRLAGHMQAKSLPAGFYPRLEKLNRLIEDAWDDGAEGRQSALNSPHHTIYGLASQAYNSLMHHTRGFGSAHHEVQTGVVTNALAGSLVQGNRKLAAKAKEFKQRCRHELPHDRYRHKIRKPTIERDLRWENVYVIDLRKLPMDWRSGEVIAERILFPLCDAWDHASLLPSLKKHLVLFKPEAFPAVYNWTTYPLTLAITSVWDSHVAQNYETSSSYIEMCSVLERALNYMHTGNAKVIATSVMNPLWIGRALIHDGLPCLNERILLFKPTNGITLRRQHWPHDAAGLPMTSAKRAITYTYGDDVYYSFVARLATEIIIFTSFDDDKNPALSRVTSLARVIFSTLKLDCQMIVQAHVNEAVQDDHNNGGEASKVTTARLKALKAWKKLEYPLSWDCEQSKYNGGLTYLLRILSPTASPLKELPASNTTYTTAELVDHLLAIGCNDDYKKAPMHPKGQFPHGLKVLMEYILRCVQPDLPNWEKHVKLIFSNALRHHGIHFLPWSQNSNNPMAHHILPTAKCWMLLGGSHRPVQQGLPFKDDARQAAQKAARANRTANWTLPSRLSDMGELWMKEVLPEEWSLKAASVTIPDQDELTVVHETYQYVATNFDGRRSVHRLAMILGILFSCAAPYIGYDAGKLPRTGDLPHDITAAVRGLPWIESTKGGVKETSSLMTMMTTAIIGYLDQRSPLAKQLQASNRSGTEWTTKHGAKLITPVNLVRLRVAHALTRGVTRAPKYGVHWKPVAMEEVRALLHQLQHFLCSDGMRHGEFNAFRHVFGQQSAENAGRRGQFPVPM